MMLEIRDVRKSFDGQTVLDGISLDVEKGDVVAILGPSGSGKTTFLRCLNYLETADSGSMVFDGEHFDLHNAGKKDIARLRRKTAFVFQNDNVSIDGRIVYLPIYMLMFLQKEEATSPQIYKLNLDGLK